MPFPIGASLVLISSRIRDEYDSNTMITNEQYCCRTH